MKSSVLFLSLSLLVCNGFGQSSGVSRIADQRTQGKKEIKAKQTLQDNHYSTVRLGRKETFAIATDSVYVDSLFMDEKSVLRFTRDAVLIVENAFIGNECVISSAGVDGRKAGEHGERGMNISLVIVFKALVTLTIDTHGGDGAAGVPGKAGAEGQGFQEIGGPGGQGGDGGNGGALKLFYDSDGFIPVFNGAGQHTIQLVYSGGKAGAGGAGGRGGRKLITDGTGRTTVCGTCPPGPAGSRGPSGAPGVDGELRFERISN